MAIFERWLWETPDALAYCRGRGWTDETIRAHHLGYSRDAGTLRRELAAVGLDAAGRAANTAASIPNGMLIYPHIEQGQVRYFSGRVASRDRKGHYNPPNNIAGPRQPFWNAIQGDECVIVEGQADAVTLGQWGISAVALAGCGLAAAAERGLLRRLARMRTVYVWPDGDGRTDVTGLGCALGPLLRVVEPPEGVKDANEWLQAGMTEDQARELLAAAEPWIMLLARKAGQAQNAEREPELRAVFREIAKLDEFSISAWREELCHAMRIGVRQFNNMLKSLREEMEKEEQEAEGILFTVPMVGGYINDTLFELVYEPAEDTHGVNGHSGGRTWFAVRTPEGEIERRDWIEFDHGVRYVPLSPSKFLSEMIVEFPMDIGPEKTTRELVEIIRSTIHKYVEIDPFYEKLAAYYVLFTWLYDCFNTVPYLRALGDYGTGKSRFKDVVGAMCYRPIKANAGATISPVFRTLDKFRGTLLFDEGDFRYSDESADFVKLFNVGYQRRQGVILRAGDKNSGFEPEVYVVYGPKILATRKEFQDKALESRCLTKRMEGQLTRDDIPLEMPNSFYEEEAPAIRNMLLRYRLTHWQPSIELDTSDVDRSIEPRLNQVTMALKTIVDDPDLREDINLFIQEYNRELITDRGLTATSKILEVILVTGPDGDLTMKAIAERVNRLIDYENYGDEGDEDEDKGRRKRMTARGVGSAVKNELGLQREREPHTRRYRVVWNETRLEALRKRFGLEEELLENTRQTLARLENRTADEALPGLEMPAESDGTREEIIL